MSSEIVAVKSALALTGVWFFLFHLWRDYRIDAFRDHVFSLRDKLFMFAASGEVAFDDPAYTMLRYRINVVLRYAHEFTLFRVLSVVLIKPASGKSPDREKWDAAVDRLPSSLARKELRSFNSTLAIAIVKLMVFRSFFLYLAVRPISPFIRTQDVLRNRPEVVTRVEQLESQALEEDADRRCAEMTAA